MNKKGFAFLESVIVLVVVVAALTVVLAGYTVLTNKAENDEYYDKASDKYLLYSISNLGNKSVSYYPNSATDNFKATAENCNATKMGQKLNTLTSGDDETSCSKIFTDFNIDTIYVVYSIKEILDSNHSSSYSMYDNGTIQYMNNIAETHLVNGSNVDIKYMIGVFYRNGHYYYASIEL